jgi:hypothetical protein
MQRRIVIGSCLIILSLISLLPAFETHGLLPTCSASQSSFWQICGPIQAYAGLDLQPAALQAMNGSLWLAWMGNHDQNNRITTNYNILYASRMTNGTWLQTSLLTNLGGRNQNPALAQISNGTIFFFWSYYATSSTHAQIYYRTLKGNTLSSYTKLPLTTPTGLNDTEPSAAVGKDGTLWLAWSRDNKTSSGTSAVMRQLWYETFYGGIWSPEASLTSASDVNWNSQPSMMVGNDGLVRLAFAKGVPTGNFQINLMTNAGLGWTSRPPIVNSTSSDVNPSLAQDRNGTIWLFWSRYVIVSSSLSAYVVYSKYSVDNGAHWSAERNLIAPSCGSQSCTDNEYPAAVQSGPDLKIWVFYASDPTTTNTGFDIWSLQSLPLNSVHNVALSSLSSSSNLQYQGGLASIGQSANVSISVIVTDPGDFNETVTLTLTATNTTNYPIGIQSARILKGGAYVFVFNWNTTSIKPARYGLSAVLAPVPGQGIGNQANNTLKLNNQIHILPLGDVDQDGSVTITDVTVFFYDYNAVKGMPGSRYNPYCDIVNTGIINIVDIGVVLATYNTFT